MWRKSYPYLNDNNFITEINTQHLQDYYLKLTLLDWDENPLQEIQGLATGGSISYNGNSSMRRTCNLTMTVKNLSDVEVTNTQNLISVNKKVFLEVGISNNTNKFEKEYPIIWFPQGLYVFTNCSITYGINSPIILTAQMKDKMCLLNGECGGTIAATTQFNKWDTINAEGDWITEYPTIATIIREAVNHFGEEQLGRILISDIDERVKQRIRWIGSDPVYLINDHGNYFLTTDKSEGEGSGIQTFEYGDDIGFVYTDFIYPDDLIANPGDNIVTAVLEKIQSFLGNFEFFYDVYGNFVFQEIKNYLNTTQATVVINNLKNEDYKIDISKGKSVYNFSDNKLITSFSNTPQLNRIKNDFVIWGERKGANDTEIPIRYHLAIDKKPKIGNIYDVYFYVDPDDGLRKAKVPITFESKDSFPEQGVVDLFYLDKSTGLIYKWDPETLEYVSLNGNAVEEYPTYADFPERPDENTIYVDLAEKNSYMWLININSQHYKDYQELIDIRTEEYEEEKEDLERQISIIKATISNIENNIAKLNLEYKPYLDEINSYTQDINNINKIVSTYNAQIEQYNILINNYEQQIIDYGNEYSNYITLANQASTEEEKQKYLQLAEIANENKELAETRKTAVETEKAAAQTVIDSTDGKISMFEEYILQVQSKITDYYTKLDSYNNSLNDYKARLATLEAELEQKTNTYNTELAELKYLQKEYIEVSSSALVKVQTTDWRSELYLEGVTSETLGLESNYYWAELKAEWPKIYNLTANNYIDDQGNIIYTGDFYEGVLEHPWDLDYWLDFIDAAAAIGELSVKNIGRRTFSENKDTYNCLFEPEVPDFVIIEKDQPDTEEKRQECEKRNQKYIQADSSIYALTASGLQIYGCFERIKECLYDYTSYNDSISFTTVPIYNLEPNTRVTIQNKESNVFGDYLIQSISVPLTVDGAMNISAIKCNSKL